MIDTNTTSHSNLNSVLFNFIQTVINNDADIDTDIYTGEMINPYLFTNTNNHIEPMLINTGLSAAITIEIALLITILFSYIFFGFLIPNNIKELYYFLFLAFLIGYIIDKAIAKYHIFGNRLNEYYKKLGSGFWGAAAFLFSIATSYFIQKIL